MISLNGLDQTVSDFSVTNDDKLNKTVFGFYWTTEPGTKKEINLQYRLPETIRKAIESNGYYDLIWQKQAGSRAKTQAIINYKNIFRQINLTTDQNIRVN